MGQHTNASRSTPDETPSDDRAPTRRGLVRTGIAAALVVALAGGVYVVWDKSRSDCGDVQPVSVVAEGDLGGYVSQLADRAEQNSCFDFTVEAVPASHVNERLTANEGADIWIAESPSRVRQVGTALGRTWSDIGPSIGKTPIVVAGKRLPELPSWSRTLSMPALRVDPPARSDVSNAAVIGALAEMSSGSMTHEQLVETLTMRALRMNDDDGAPDLKAMAADDAQSMALTTERAYAGFAGTGEPELEVRVPLTGTVALDYRVANVAAAGRQGVAGDAIVALVDALKTPEGQKIQQDNHIRTADGAPLTGGAGVGTARVIDPPSRELVDNIARKWTALTLPIRTLVAQDVSASMKRRAGARTRADLLRDASVVGLSKFPRNTALGYWEFSINRGGDGVPYREVMPIAPIMDRVGGRTNRDALGEAIKRTLADLHGGTGLYDTTLAAFRSVYESYDPAYMNSVIIMTDGRNEDRNSISLEQLVSELNIMKNPGRRIPIITVGISEDADAAALKRISDATGGSSFIARDPNDIATILMKAVSFRADVA